MEWFEYDNEIPLNTLKMWRDSILSTAQFEHTGWTGENREPYRHWAFYPKFEGIYKTIFECLNESFILDGFNFSPERILLNMYGFGDSSWIHRDSDEHGGWTAVLFLSEFWNPNWHGQLVLLDDSQNNVIKSFMPVPGRFVLFKNSILHAAAPVSREAQFPRMALAIQCINKLKI